MTDQTVAPQDNKPETEAKTKTSYVILKKIPTTGVVWGEGADPLTVNADAVYVFVTYADAVSGNAAIRALKNEGTFVAVPSRSFNDVKVKAETQTVLKLS